MEKMKWKNLLTNTHIVSDISEDTKEQYYNPFEEDYKNIISSQSFRALQDKTQVFPLDKGDFVRTRLTHSIEVSTIARQIVSKIFYSDRSFMETLNETQKKTLEEIYHELSECTDDGDYDQSVAQIQTIAACAGLLHDMGNPPFGHFGEGMVRNFFKEKFKDRDFKYGDKEISSILKPKQQADFLTFEGNAQALRLVSKIKNESEVRGDAIKHYYNMNLSYAIMNTVIKYPNASHENTDKNDRDVRKHKNGYYRSEEEIMKEIGECTGTRIDGKYVRHPITYIMEAADDISYATHDLADAIKKEKFSIEQFVDDFYYHLYEFIRKRMLAYVDHVYDGDEKETQRREYEAYLERFLEGRNYFAVRKCREKEKDKKKENENQEDMESFESDDKRKVFVKVLKESWFVPYNNISSLDEAIVGTVDMSGRDFMIFESWLQDMRKYLVEEAAKMFLDHYDEIMAGSYEGDLFSSQGNSDLNENWDRNDDPNMLFPSTVAGAVLEDMLKAPMPKYVYDSTEIIGIEISAKPAIETVLETYINIMLKYEPQNVDGVYNIAEDKSKDKENDKSGMGVVYDRFLKLIPDNLLWDYVYAKQNIVDKKDEDDRLEWDLYYKLLTVTDFVSGMTDSYATYLYKMIIGVN